MFHRLLFVTMAVIGNSSCQTNFMKDFLNTSCPTRDSIYLTTVKGPSDFFKWEMEKAKEYLPTIDTYQNMSIEQLGEENKSFAALKRADSEMRKLEEMGCYTERKTKLKGGITFEDLFEEHQKADLIRVEVLEKKVAENKRQEEEDLQKEKQQERKQIAIWKDYKRKAKTIGLKDVGEGPVAKNIWHAIQGDKSVKSLLKIAFKVEEDDSNYKVIQVLRNGDAIFSWSLDKAGLPTNLPPILVRGNRTQMLEGMKLTPHIAKFLVFEKIGSYITVIGSEKQLIVSRAVGL